MKTLRTHPLTLAAEQGDARAQINLGLMYYNGKGVPQDDKTAVKWYRLAAKQGHSKSKKIIPYLVKRIAKTNADLAKLRGEGPIEDLKAQYQWYIQIKEMYGPTVCCKN